MWISGCVEIRIFVYVKMQISCLKAGYCYGFAYIARSLGGRARSRLKGGFCMSGDRDSRR
jgi:hypothetical protein